MDHFFKKIALLAALSFSASAFADEIPITLLSNAKHTYSVPINKIVDIVKQTIPMTPSSGYASAKVQVIYDNNHHPDYLLVYLLSAKTYQFSVTKIKINDKYQMISVTPSYHLQKNDFAQQPIARRARSACPDESVEFVAATPVSDYPTAKDAVDHVSEAAKAKGYSTVVLYDDDASIESYSNWLSCPKLKGFFNVGHGNSDGILLSDGVLSHDFFTNDIPKQLSEKTVVVFNSCEVDNDPLKSSVVEDADAQKYAGGVTELEIGPSESASKCFWDAAFKKQPLTAALTNCNQKYDSDDTFGIDGHGADVLS